MDDRPPPDGPNLFPGPVIERTNVVEDGCAWVDRTKTTFRDWSKPKGKCYNHRRYDDRESQHKVSEEVH